MVKLLFRSGQPQQATTLSKGQTPWASTFSSAAGGRNCRSGSAAAPAIARGLVRGYLSARETVDSA
jgi:hypothetical protein